MLEAADNKRHDLTLAFTITFGTLIVILQIFIFVQLNKKRFEAQLFTVKSTASRQFDDSERMTIPQEDHSLEMAFRGERSPILKA